MTAAEIPEPREDNPEVHYAEHAEEELSAGDFEASVANADEGYDMDEAIRHTLYIGWIMGIAKDKGLTAIRHAGGNRLEISLSSNDQSRKIILVVPMPPAEWRP